MALSHDFRQTVSERIECDPAFAKALLDEAASPFFNGEQDTARHVLCDQVNATVGFEALARPSKSLHRMLSSNGNPSMDNQPAIFEALRDRLKVEIQVHTADAA
jgi:DNA-binding phage protein